MSEILVVVAVEAERAALGAECVASPSVHVVVSGIGRTNAAAAVADALARNPRISSVISVGIAGVLPGGSASIGDLVISSACIYAEEGIALPDGFGDMTALGFPLGDFPGNTVPVDAALLAHFRTLGMVGMIATVATCSGSNASANAVRARTGAVAEAMEGAAVVHAARRAGIAGIEIRAISNTTGDRAAQQWDIRRALAALTSVGQAIKQLVPH